VGTEPREFERHLTCGRGFGAALRLVGLKNAYDPTNC
jgi:hypothetical protein